MTAKHFFFACRINTDNINGDFLYFVQQRDVVSQLNTRMIPRVALVLVIVFNGQATGKIERERLRQPQQY